MNAVLTPIQEECTSIELGPIVMERGKLYTLMHKGNLNIKVPIIDGTMEEIQNNMEQIWEDILSLPGIDFVIRKHGVVVERIQ